MNLDLPFWIRQRQTKVEPVSTGSYRLTGPNLPEAVVSVRIDDSLRWRAAVAKQPGGPDIASTPPEFDSPRDALNAAFELYRGRFVV
jgi:hypothetical protein